MAISKGRQNIARGFSRGYATHQAQALEGRYNHDIVSHQHPRQPDNRNTPAHQNLSRPNQNSEPLA